MAGSLIRCFNSEIELAKFYNNKRQLPENLSSKKRTSINPMIQKITYHGLAICIVAFAVGCTGQPEDAMSEQRERNNIKLPTKYDTLKNVAAYPDTVTPPLELSLTKAATFEGHPLTGAPEVLVGRTGNFTIDDSNKVYSVHGHAIHVFDSNGTYLKKLGGDGRGPGEFRNMTGIKPVIKSGRLYAYDDVLRRLNIFDTQTLELVKTVPIDPGIWSDIPHLQQLELRDYVVYSDSLMLLNFHDTAHRDSMPPYYAHYFLINIDNKTMENEVLKYALDEEKSPFMILPNGQTDWPFPNASGRYMQVQFGPDNYIYTSRTGDFLVKIHSPKGQYRRAIYYPYENPPLDKQDIIDSYTKKTFIERAEEHEYPATWPAIDRFFVDDEKRIWVATITDDENFYEWWVLKNSGELLAKFKWLGQRVNLHDPFRVPPKVKNGFFYDKQTDSTTGISQLVKYRIDLAPSPTHSN